MYAPHFGLRQEPFSIAPDPRYLYMSECHREALAHLLYGLAGGGGFVLLTGEIGTGKTTVCRCFLEQVPAHCNLAYIFNPKLTVLELLQSVCDEFRIELPPREGLPRTVKDYIDPLNAFLLRAHAAGRNNVLVIDEAQNLSADVLEQLRLLTNLETPSRKLLQIILIGQPELRALLARPELEQLAQRIVARYHLLPLDERDTARYVQHRLAVAASGPVQPFGRRAIRRIHRLSRGVPRRINLLCDRAMLGAYARAQGRIDTDTVDQAAAEVFGREGRRAPRSATAWRPAALVLGGLAALAWAGWVALAGWPALAAWPRLGEGPARWLAGGGPPAPSHEQALAPDAEGAAPVYLSLGPEGAILPSAMLLRDADVAWRELARDWKVEPPAGAVCPALARHSLHCFSAPLSLAMIRQLDRPGVVTLDARSDAPSYALLVALTPTSATLRAAGMEQTVTLGALAQRWDGRFATLWRAPPGYTGSWRDTRGYSAALQWTATQLASGEAVARSEMIRSPRRFRERLHDFQVAHGLPATDLPTAPTYMQLNRVAGIDEPSLRPQP